MNFTWDGIIYSDGTRRDYWVNGDMFISNNSGYNVYQATKPLKGRKPWTVDNKRLNRTRNGKGFDSLKEAIEFASNQNSQTVNEIHTLSNAS